MPIGVDTGGTFTDVVVRAADGTLRTFKLLSTPSDPSAAIAHGVDAVGDGESWLVHGTTVATNALLERRGARVAFVTTAGFEDVLAIARQNRPELYDLEPLLPAPLVDRANAVGVAERLAYDGSVLKPLDQAEVERVVAAVGELKIDAVAVCLLHAYANDTHERILAEALREADPTLHVSVSSELAPEFREYERASTVAINAYVGPIMARYLGSLRRRLPTMDIEILQSSGGRASLEDAGASPAHTILSGPAGGVVGAVAAAREVGIDRIITFDMGGTSTDVSLCDGEPKLRHDAEVDGFPVRLPTLDIVTVGAGGGSIARRDLGGALRVGPESAGASPGPACYGRGGTAPTVTDAHLFLRRLVPERFLGGEMPLDVAASTAVIENLAAQLDLTPTAAAEGILDVADAAMVRAIKIVSIQRGRDPRDYVLVSFGGAGGLHACRLADALEIDTILVPRDPGLLSAYGMLHAPRSRYYTRSVLRPLDGLDLSEIRRELSERASRDLGAAVVETHTFDLRYAGQSFEVGVAGATAVELADAFEDAHERLYGYRDESRAIEVVVARLAARADDDVLEAPPPSAPQVSTGVVGPVVERNELTEGQIVSGPLVITEYSGTTVLAPGWTAEVKCAHLLLRRSET